MVDRSADRPIYKQVADVIRDKITSGQYAAGDDLPTAATLAAEYDVGRDTVRDALAVLRAEGLIVTERGRPAYVAGVDAQTVTLGPGDHVDVRGGTVTVTRNSGGTETYTAGTVRIVGGR